MKRISTPLFRSKTALLSICLAAGIAIAIPACKKDDDDSSTPAVSEQQVSQIVSDAVVSQQGGSVLVQTSQAASIATGYMNVRHGAKAADCGASDKGEYVFANEPNSNPYYSISLKYNWVLSCTTDGKDFQSFSFDFSGKTGYSTAKFALADSSAAKYIISGLADTSTYLIINQDYKQNASIESNDASMPSLSSAIKYISSDIKLDKSSLEVVSGSATLSISGKTTAGRSFSYDGKITFQGKRKATFTITGGGSSTLTW